MEPISNEGGPHRQTITAHLGGYRLRQQLVDEETREAVDGHEILFPPEPTYGAPGARWRMPSWKVRSVML